MAEVENARELLIMAIKDLHDGECAMVERLGPVREHASDPMMQELIAEDRSRSEDQRNTLEAIARALDGAPGEARNIWLRAILDDADNDARTIARGPWRDVALAGALRKGKQSQRVSYETAIALARRLEMPGWADTLDGMAVTAEATDTALGQVLERLCQQA